MIDVTKQIAYWRRGAEEDWEVGGQLFSSGRVRQSLFFRIWLARTDSRIEPIPCGARQWEEGDSKAIIEVARREGVRILPLA